MKTKMFVFAATIMAFALIACQSQAQSNPCGAASFTFYGNFQNQQVRLYFIGVDGNLYNTLANNLAGNYADPQAAYLYDAIMNSNNPIASVVAQIVMNSNGVAQDGPNTFVAPNSPQLQSVLQEALVWSYMQYWYSYLNQQSEMNLEQTDFQQVYQSEWQQQAGVTAASWVNAATVIGQLAEYLPSLMGDADAATQVGDFVSLFQDASEDYSGLQSAFAGNATNILNVLTNYDVVTDQHYTSAQLVVGMANLDPSRLPQFETDLYAAAYPSVTLKPNAQPIITTFLENAGAGAEKLGISASASGAYAFYQAYGVYELTASTSAKIALSQAGTYFASGLTALAAAQLITSSYTTPQSDILRNMVYCQNILTTNLFPELNTMSSQMMSNNGFPNFDNGVGFAADIEAISSFEALWCNLGAQEETNQFIQTQLQQYITLGPAFGGRAASMYGTLVSANAMAQNLANQSAAISVPAVNGLGETHGVLGDEFTISGANFCNAVAVYFNNSPAWFHINSSTSITTVAPAGTGTVDIHVVGPGGVSQINANDIFTYGTAGLSLTNKVISLTGNLTFGNVTVETSAQRTLTIGNTGNTNLAVTSISYPSGFSGSWAGIIPQGGLTNVTVTFSPTSATSQGGNVTVNSDKTSGGNTISVSGTGVNVSSTATRIIDVVPESGWSFGNVQANTIATRTVTIVSEGTTNLVISGISYPPGFSGNWSGTILHGNQVVIAICFSPTALISYSGTMTVNSDATSGVGTIPISGTGVRPPPPPTNRVSVSAFETLHSFADFDGNNPYGTLIQANDGGFYGTTYRGGGTGLGGGVGTIFQIAPDGTFTNLYFFNWTNNTIGTQPYAGLVQDTDGNFYGTTQDGGTNGDGTIFRITSYGTLTTLFTFNSFSGVAPWNLVEGSDGNFYGTSESGGTGYGNTFRITPNGVFTNLFSFHGSDGSDLHDGLVLGTDGNFYGTTLSWRDERKLWHDLQDYARRHVHQPFLVQWRYQQFLSIRWFGRRKRWQFLRNHSRRGHVGLWYNIPNNAGRYYFDQSLFVQGRE